MVVCRKYDKLLDEFSSPKEGSKALKFDTVYPKPFMVQFHTVFAKYFSAYWRMPEYNGSRFFYAVVVGLLFGAIFWRNGYAFWLVHCMVHVSVFLSQVCSYQPVT